MEDTKKLSFSSIDEILAFLQTQFPDVEPTMEDHYKSLLTSFEFAAKRLIEKKKQQLEKERREMITKMWTYQQMYDRAYQAGKLIAIAENFRKDFVIDQYNEKAFHLLCLYFTNDPRFEEEQEDGMQYSLQKGIWLQSSVRGSGKSTLLKCFRINKRCCFGYKHTAELANAFQKKGYDAIDYFIGTIPQPVSASNFFQNHAGFMYDELFGEGKVNHMGTPLMVSEYIINSLYDFSDNKKGEMWKFHVTSNASGQDIENISGKTYRSRMPDMFNLIKLDGPNRRIN